jgi:hypothetical protein
MMPINVGYDLIEYSAFVGFILIFLLLVLAFMLKGVFPGKRFRYAMPISNLFILSLVLVLRLSTDDALADMIWNVPLKLDFFLFFVRDMFSQFLGLFHSRVLVPVIVFGLAGVAQYYVLGVICDYLWEESLNLGLKFYGRKGK